MRLLLFAALLMTTACNPLIPPPLEPPALPESYATVQPQAAIKPAERWWRDFHDEQLDLLQERLFSSNLNLRQALHRLEQLEAAQRINQAKRLPNLNVNGSLGRTQSVGFTGETRSTNSSLSLAASYEIDLWNKLKDSEQASILRTQAGKAEVEALLLSLSAQLSEQYFLAVEQRAQLDLLERQTANTRELLQIVTERYRAGLSTAAELYQARQNLAIMETRVPPYRSTLIQTENNIALLLGQTPRTVRIERRQLPELAQAIDLGLPATLLTRRPDIAATLLELQATDHDLAAILAERLPAINLSTTLGQSATRLASGDYNGTFWSLILGLTQPLYDGGRLKALSDQQKAARAQQLALCEATLLTALEEVESALTAELNSADSAALLEQRRRINQSNLELLRRNYLYGLSDSSDLLSSEINHLDILSQQLSNQRQWLSNRITLVRALGGGWMAAELDKQRQALSAKQE